MAQGELAKFAVIVYRGCFLIRNEKTSPVSDLGRGVRVWRNKLNRMTVRLTVFHVRS